MKKNHPLIILLLVISSSLHCYYDDDISTKEILDYPVVVSLERHMYRFTETSKLMEKAGFTNIQRFDAVDGKHTSDKLFESLNIRSGKPGEKGCAASHLLIWKNFSEDDSDKPYLFVCEDDMVPHSDFREIFPIYWDATPKDFDIVMVGFWLHSKKNKPKDLIVSIPTYTTHAYIVSKKGAKKLYDLYQKITGKNSHIIDFFLVNQMKKKNITYYCYNGNKYPENIINKTKINFTDGICFQNANLPSVIKDKMS